MSLDLQKLEKVRELGNGVIKARCPACAEGGHDRSGEHLRIYPDGRFGCCVHPKDSEHRKRIFALVGVRKKPNTFLVRVKAPALATAAQSVKAALTGFSAGTLGTGKIESEPSRKVTSQTSQGSNNESHYADSEYFGTPGTAIFQSRARTGEEQHTDAVDIIEKLKDSDRAVPSVPRCLEVSPLKGADPLPYITAAGDLVIPFEGPQRYHWWKGGQSLEETRREARQRFCAEPRKDFDDTDY